MPEKAAAPMPHKGLLLRLLRILAWTLILVAVACAALYLAFGPARLAERLAPPPPTFPATVVTSPDVLVISTPTPTAPPADSGELVALMLESTADIWGEFLARGDFAYKQPKLQLYRGQVANPCRAKGQFSGPFYCSEGMQLYLDMDYLEALQRQSPELGSFALSYVIAREVGFHVQNLTGVNGWIKEFRQQGTSAEKLATAQSLLSDCLAGSWISYAQRKYAWLRPGDALPMLEAINALNKGRGASLPPLRDDPSNIDVQMRGEWLGQGITTGDPRECTLLFTSQVE
ncbi:neutral zinc metallopeptidase [Metapseudomonas furukawaii]|uniref:neutral zinc metallopeptidase n=1 Tax=Metapseudomonas furukawaii TaxID=1149133 RepID=UPI00227D3946|nr:neutral zinc metallopeptidase [Pseudomonas furukawaii]WAG80478.1 neutral zinc metallopeptidase [Pseudomonas furukawaii]